MDVKKKITTHSPTFIFLITLVISLISLAIFAYIILDVIVFEKVEAGDIKVKQSIYTPDKKDNQTILIIGKNQTELEYATLMFYNANSSRIMFIPLPLNTFSQVNTKKSTLKSFYDKNNSKNLCQAIENLFDISVQKYIELSPTLLNTLVKNTGNITFDLACDMNYKNPQTNEVTKFSKDNKIFFNGSDLRKVILYPHYPDGLYQNMYYTGIIFATLVNNFIATSEDIFETLDIMYADVILQSNTSIDEYDFYSRKLSFRYMIQKNKEPAIYILPDGEINKEEYFIMTTDYRNTIHEYIVEQ